MECLPAFGLMAIYMIVGATVSLGIFAFWLWMLVDCIKNEPSEGNDKIIWVLVIVLLHGLGALIYLLARRPTRIQMFGR